MHSRHSSTSRRARRGALMRPGVHPLRRAIRRRRLGTGVAAVVLTLVAGLLLGGRDQDPASATAIAADFDRGNIISDTAFYDSTALSDVQIQQFLSARNPNCSGSLCLKNYVTTTGARSADGLCSGYTGGLAQTAAQIIGGIARSCGISPKVLIVLLEKEEGLVSDTTPGTGQYRIATGYGCPDTAACDSTYYGFFNQVYSAARQFEAYTINPGRYTYKAGQYNSIYYNPNYGCGSSSIYVANQATANLYNYTPYQPNAAAMAHLYGLGDACSAYGNRNFWRLFTDWFGNPQAGSYLVRTPDNATVYLLSGTTKYPIADMATIASLAPLGSVGYVSQAYLDRRTTGQLMSRVVLAPNGTVYFIDSGIKLPFASCAQVADYGADCASLVQLEQTEIDAFWAGPFITATYRTTSGKTFYVSGAVKREVADDQSLTAAGLNTASVTLAESGLGYLPYGQPVIRDGIVLQNRSTTALTVTAGGTLTTVPEALRTATPWSTLPVRPMDEASLRLLSAPVTLTGPLVKSDSGAQVYLLTGEGKRQVADPTMLPTSVPAIPAAALELLPDADPLAAGTFLKGAGKVTVYNLLNGKARPVGSWADLVGLAGGNASPSILVLDQRIADLLTVGPQQAGPGTLVVSPRSATVYFVNGVSELIPVASFAMTNDLGATRIAAVSDATIDTYTVRNAIVTSAVDCGGTRYLGIGGSLYQVGADVAGQYTLSYTTIDPLACAALPKAPIGLTRFLRDPNGTIYWIEGGTKRPIRSMGTYVGLGGTAANTIQATPYALSLLPTGTLY